MLTYERYLDGCHWKSLAPFGTLTERWLGEVYNRVIAREAKEMCNAAPSVGQIIVKTFYDYLTMLRTLQLRCASICLKITQPCLERILNLKVWTTYEKNKEPWNGTKNKGVTWAHWISATPSVGFKLCQLAMVCSKSRNWEHLETFIELERSNLMTTESNNTFSKKCGLVFSSFHFSSNSFLLYFTKASDQAD